MPRKGKYAIYIYIYAWISRLRIEGTSGLKALRIMRITRIMKARTPGPRRSDLHVTFPGGESKQCFIQEMVTGKPYNTQFIH